MSLLLFDHTMEGVVSKQALLYVANLTIPSVIVISANLGCAYCRQRASEVISKITGLKEYTVDVRNKLITATGDVKLHIASHDNKKQKHKKNHFPKLFTSRSCLDIVIS